MLRNKDVEGKDSVVDVMEIDGVSTNDNYVDKETGASTKSLQQEAIGPKSLFPSLYGQSCSEVVWMKRRLLGFLLGMLNTQLKPNPWLWAHKSSGQFTVVDSHFLFPTGKRDIDLNSLLCPIRDVDLKNVGIRWRFLQGGCLDEKKIAWVSSGQLQLYQSLPIAHRKNVDKRDIDLNSQLCPIRDVDVESGNPILFPWVH
ncbi:hypothetical protein Tco_1380016 [Tanacetum coccineum]